MRFEPHTVVLLVRPENAPELSEDESNRLQDAPLANQATLVEQGHVIAAGPLVDQDDERLRGIAILSVDPDTARRLYSTDPKMQAGQAAFQVMTRMVAPGEVPFRKVPHPPSTAQVMSGLAKPKGKTSYSKVCPPRPCPGKAG